MNIDRYAQWRDGTVTTDELIRESQAELEANLTSGRFRSAERDRFTKLAAFLDEKRVEGNLPESLTGAAKAVYKRRRKRKKETKPKFNATLADIHAATILFLEHEEQERALLPPYISVPDSPFILEIPRQDKIAVSQDLASLGLMARLPDDLTPQELRHARLLALRFFGGWSVERIANHDGIPIARVDNDWSSARAWLSQQTTTSQMIGGSATFDSLDRQVLIVLSQTPELIHTLEWRTFERILAGVLEQIGYEVELQRGTKDGGIDVIAIKRDTIFGPHRYLIQAKRWKHRVGVAAVRELLYLKQALGATKACLATTSTFTSGAQALARDNWWHLELRDFQRLQEWISSAVRSP